MSETTKAETCAWCKGPTAQHRDGCEGVNLGLFPSARATPCDVCGFPLRQHSLPCVPAALVPKFVPATPAPTEPQKCRCGEIPNMPCSNCLTFTVHHEPRVPMLECDECAELRHTLTGRLGEIHDCPRRGAFRLVHYPASVADAPTVPEPTPRCPATWIIADSTRIASGRASCRLECYRPNGHTGAHRSDDNWSWSNIPPLAPLIAPTPQAEEGEAAANYERIWKAYKAGFMDGTDNGKPLLRHEHRVAMAEAGAREYANARSAVAADAHGHTGGPK